MTRRCIVGIIIVIAIVFTLDIENPFTGFL
jgi:hypothetical protein